MLSFHDCLLLNRQKGLPDRMANELGEHEERPSPSQALDAKAPAVEITEAVASSAPPSPMGTKDTVTERKPPAKRARTYKDIWAEEPMRFPHISNPKGQRTTFRDVFTS